MQSFNAFQYQTPWKFLLSLWLVLSIVTTAVPVIAWLKRPEGSIYTGHSLVSAGDIFVYLNFIDQARQGNALFPVLMVPAEQPAPKVIHPLFLLLGWGAAAFNASPLVMWHVGRVLLSLVVLILLWRFLARSGGSQQFLRWALLGIVFGGGLYWVNHEGSTFASFFYSPLSLATLCLTVLYFTALFDGHNLGWSTRRVVALHVITVVQAMIHPYVLPLWLGVGFLFFVFEWVQTQRGTLLTPVVAATSVGLAYAYLLTLLFVQPALRSFVTAFHVIGISPLQLISYFVFLPLAIAGMALQRRWIRHGSFGRFVTVWFLLNWILLFSPYLYSGRLLLTAHIPAALFVVCALYQLGRFLLERVVRITVLAVFSILLIGANTLLVVFDAMGAYTGAATYRYIDSPTKAGLQWVRAATPATSAFLTSPAWDTLFVEQTDRRAYFTSGGFTSDYELRITNSLLIYAGRFSPADLQSFLNKNNIRYVLVSNLEKHTPFWIIPRALQGSPDLTRFQFDSAQYPFLERVYSERGFIVYRVTTPPPP